MKDIYTLYEGLLRGQQSTLDGGEKDIFSVIKEFLKENYKGKCIISKKPNKDGLYEVSSNESIIVKDTITSLTNGLFIWTNIKGNFNCSYCEKLTSLEGAPKDVGGSFNCSYCEKLTSLEGAPEKVRGNFNCSYCEKLTSLEGAPEEVGFNFSCYGCKLLTSLEGAPEEIGHSFNCFDCGEFFTKDYIKKISKIKGNINC